MQSATGGTARANAITYRWVQVASPKGEPLIVRVPILATDLTTDAAALTDS